MILLLSPKARVLAQLEEDKKYKANIMCRKFYANSHQTRITLNEKSNYIQLKAPYIQ